MSEAVPDCLEAAYRFLAKDRAWVAILPCDGCEIQPVGPHTHTLASSATCREVAQHPVARNYLNPLCPMGERAAFLLGGVKMMEHQYLTEV